MSYLYYHEKRIVKNGNNSIGTVKPLR